MYLSVDGQYWNIIIKSSSDKRISGRLYSVKNQYYAFTSKKCEYLIFVSIPSWRARPNLITFIKLCKILLLRLNIIYFAAKLILSKNDIFFFSEMIFNQLKKKSESFGSNLWQYLFLNLWILDQGINGLLSTWVDIILLLLSNLMLLFL